MPRLAILVLVAVSVAVSALTPALTPAHAQTCYATGQQCGGQGLPTMLPCCTTPGDYCFVETASMWRCSSLPAAPPTTTPCQATYGQCGGASWSGPTCCSNAADVCIKYNDWYSQCLPVGTNPPSSASCRATYAQCGGQGYTGATCCARPGDVCLATSAYYAQCVPSAGLPTTAPTSAAPTTKPTTAAPTTKTPTVKPTTAKPTPQPTADPTQNPTAQPTAEPTPQPTADPTQNPTAQPTAEPTPQPTADPTSQPSASPTSPPDFDAYATHGAYGQYYEGSAPPVTAPPLPSKPTKPNVLLMYADDLRLEIPPYNPDVPIVMPNFAAFAGRSLVFTSHYTAWANCGPTRAAMLSSRRPDVLRTWNFINPLRQSAPKVKTLPEVFRDNGYTTKSIGKVFHWYAQAANGLQDDTFYSWNSSMYPAIQDGGVCPGVVPNQVATAFMWCSCDVGNEDPCDDTLITNEAVASLQGYAASSTPFFLAVGFRRPHTPFSYPSWLREQFKDIEVKLPAVTIPPNFTNVDAGGMPTLAYLSCATGNSSQIYSSWLPNEPLPPSMVTTVRREYYTSIKFLDMNLGRVLTALSDTGLDSNTMVIFLADHGFHLGERNMYCKAALFETTTHVPLIMHVPWLARAASANIETGFVEGVDIMPTTISLVLGESFKPPCMMGRDLSLAVQGTDMRALHRGWSISEFPRCPGATATGITATNFWSNPCSQVQRNLFTHMGYTIRTRNWRYTEWRKWNGTALIADWTAVGLNASELYDHRGDTWNTPGTPSAVSRGPGFDVWENLNVVKRYPAIVARLSTLLRKAALDRWADPAQYDPSCLAPGAAASAKWAVRA